MQMVKVWGQGSGEFLQRVTAGPVRRVLPGNGISGLLLNGQSRMIAQFDLLHIEENAFLLAAPSACAQSLAEELERLHFAEALEIALLPLRAGARSAGASLVRKAGGEPFPLRQEGEHWVWPAPFTGFECSTAIEGIPEGWDWARIAALVPWPPLDWDQNTPALEAGMLPWIDRDKGCYPGQEVVERSLNVGHPAKVLVSIEGNLPLVIGQLVKVGTGEGRVTSLAQENGKTRALVRVPWSFRAVAPEGFQLLHSHW